MSRPLRTLTYVALLLVAIAWLAARDAPAPAADDGPRDVTVARMQETLAALRTDIARDPRHVVVVGDSSMLSHYTLAPEDTLASVLEHDAPQRGLALRVIAFEGFDPVAYYLLVDELAALHPRAVVLIANLQAFTDVWFRRAHMKHPQLAAFVRPGRTLEAIRLPLDRAGITDASLVVLPVLRALGMSALPEALNGYRERFHDDLDRLLHLAADAATDASTYAAGGALAGTAAMRRSPPAQPLGGRPQRNANAFLRFDLYPDHLKREQSTVEVLGAAVRDLHARGIPTIVVLPPIHLQALQATGNYTQRDVAGAIALISDVVTANGGIALDLTTTLPRESYFTDAFTHFGAEGNHLVGGEMLAGIARALGDGR